MLDLVLDNPDIRTGEELTGVLADRSCTFCGPVYEMFRDIAKNENDRAWLSSHRIRYDVTRIPFLTICGEWVKTKGHYHPVAPDGDHYPEIYEVLEGRALYLLQRMDLRDLILVDAPAGSLVLIPPGYGHVTINPGPDTLTMANLVSSSFSSDYRPYEQKRGAACYLFADGSIRKNAEYGEAAAELRQVPAGPLPDPFPNRSLYQMIGDETRLDFLNNPRKYRNAFQALSLFT